MKRILYVFALLVVSAFAAEAQQRVVIGNTGQTDTYVLKPGTEFPVEAAPFIPLVEDTRYSLPLNILADTTLQIGLTTRIHPQPNTELGEDIDTTRILRSRTSTNPDSVGFIGDMISGIVLPQFTINGFAQFVPLNYYIPEIANGTFRIDSMRFFLYPLGKPITTDVEVWLVSIPQKYTGTAYKGYNFDLDNSAGINYISDGPLLVMTADSINAHSENNTIRRMSLDFTQIENLKRTVDAGSMWGVILVKSDRSNLDRMALIGAHEWTVPSNQTFGGFVGHTTGGIDSVVAVWRTNRRWSLSTESYPAYANQGWKINYNMDFFGEWTGEIKVSVEQESPVADAFTLEQNAPNPVNGETKINFSVAAENSNITLRVYNTLGQKVAELANGNYSVGKYNATLNTAALPAGSYVYVLNANGQTITRTLQVVH